MDGRTGGGTSTPDRASTSLCSTILYYPLQRAPFCFDNMAASGEWYSKQRMLNKLTRYTVSSLISVLAIVLHVCVNGLELAVIMTVQCFMVRRANV